MPKKKIEIVSILKRASVISLQLLVTAAGILYVLHDPHKRTQIAHALKQADHSWLLFGWLSYSIVELLATVRWQMLLRVQGITLGWLRAGGIVMVGLFFNMFLPGLIGGDVMRLYYVFKQTRGRKTQATLSVAMDRLFGLLSIVFLAALSLIWRFDWLKGSAATLHITYLALGLLGVGFLFVLFLFCAAGFGWLKKFPTQLPFREAFIESGNALNLYAKHRVVMVSAFALTVVSHLAYYVSYYCAGESLHRAAGQTPSLADMLAIMPLVNTVTALPISFGGVGVRETLFQQLLGNLAHVPPAIAALSASLGFAIQASWSLLGAGAFLLSKQLSNNRRR
jgi:glycosyltransferase 2 family protein